MSKTTFSIRLSPGEKIALELIAKFEDRSVGYVVRRCIQDLLEEAGFKINVGDKHKHTEFSQEEFWSFIHSDPSNQKLYEGAVKEPLIPPPD